ncbi:hypothetical protein [Knoellia sp. 3-2P3]|uniref:hypothetical protein n=1 Tax=unclassified Knoellia TaxID=2618719 RepID=UPI0023DC790A|nr:hypothetical protein [Knoellia sp. 3-2P3]
MSRHGLWSLEVWRAARGGETMEPHQSLPALHVDLEHIAQGGAMPTIIVTHQVTDTDRWLSSPKREEVLPSLGASNIRTFVNPQDRTKVGLVMDIADLDVLFAALEQPSDELAEAMKYDTVRPETMAIFVAS